MPSIGSCSVPWTAGAPAAVLGSRGGSGGALGGALCPPGATGGGMRALGKALCPLAGTGGLGGGGGGGAAFLRPGGTILWLKFNFA